MGFIPQITCRHCGNKYSAIHSRCPNCGTRRVKQTGRTAQTSAGATQGTAAYNRAASNTQWQFIFGCVLVAAVIIAVIVLISASLKGSATKAPEETIAPTPPVVTKAVVETPAPTPTPTPAPSVTSITISFLGSSLSEFAMNIGETVDLDDTVYPIESGAKVTWSSEDESIVTIDGDGVVTGVASGSTNVIASCGDVTAQCKVYVR